MPITIGNNINSLLARRYLDRAAKGIAASLERLSSGQRINRAADDPGGLAVAQLVPLLQELAPHALGADVCIFDPDLDPDGRYARLIADVVVDGLGALGSALSRPVR